MQNRQPGQGTVKELENKDFSAELEAKEQSDASFKTPTLRAGSLTDNSLFCDDVEPPQAATSRKFVELPEALVNLDKEDDGEDDNSDFECGEDSEGKDDDETDELLAELQRIKKERAEENQRKEAERRANEERIHMENTRLGNPLMNEGLDSKGSFVVKRRWDDDVVFKNCNLGNNSGKKKAFINDTIRSEFHRKFMDKYVK